MFCVGDASWWFDLHSSFSWHRICATPRFGLLSFANDQLDECLTRVWTAESLLLEDTPWVGQKMLLGMVYLIAGPADPLVHKLYWESTVCQNHHLESTVKLFTGVVQAAKNAWLKSGVNLVRSLRYIKDFEEGIGPNGPISTASQPPASCV